MFICIFLEFKVLYKPNSPPKEVEKDDLFQNPKAQQGWALIKKESLQQSQKSLSSSLTPGSVVKSELDVPIMSKFALGNWLYIS